MKIAIFTDTYEPQVNGVVTSIKRFTKELKKRGHSVYIFSPRSPEMEKKGFVHGFRSISFRAYPEYKIALPVIKGCPKKFDIVHVHSPFTVGMAGVALAKYYRIPLVGTFHTQLPEYIHYLIKRDKIRNIKQINKLAKKFTWKYCSWFYNRCDSVIAPSEEIKENLYNLRQKFRKEIVVIPTGISIKKRNKTKPELKKQYGFSVKDRLLLHVGRVTKEKNIETILEATKELLKEDHVKLVITSDGPMKQELEKKAEELGIINSTVFTGYITRKTLRDYYQMADLFIMASKTETQGLVLAEAAASGLPAVVLDADVTSDFVRKYKTGLVANRKDFAKKVKTLMNNSKMRSSFIRNCLETAKIYDIKKCTNDLMQVYSELARDN